MKSQKTREKILDVSIQLFNEKKASNVSTVQISAAMKISPGNLYYYFANKEDLIRCIWEERMLCEVEKLIESFMNTRSYEELEKVVDDCFELYEKYMFFYSETPTLFVNDPSLKELFYEKLGGSLDNLEAVTDKWHEAGMIVKMPDEIKRTFIENFIILMKAYVYRDDSDKKHYKFNVMSLIYPYLKENN